ncbi:hypothetical protein EGW08_008591 [Elysia chlorotica]|uniref:C2H2-type domain-containing protein n=1 Tax=Elysia chlorotica TaxID=188477 RepID=A0A433TPU4_ELYCH|nr:hypothetical protein EGW08_008591 [Elysia chlorotica]
MPKMKKTVLDKKCSLCHQTLGPKALTLYGVKKKKCEIMTVLEMLLPSQDFSSLCDRKLFPNPKICASCFSSVKKLPTTLLAVQNLVGKPLNIQLYKPNRQAWTASSELIEHGSLTKLKSRDSEESLSADRKSEYLEFSKRTKSPDDLVRNSVSNETSLCMNSDTEVMENKGSFPNSLGQEDQGHESTDIAQTSQVHAPDQDGRELMHSTLKEKRIFINKKLVESLARPFPSIKESELTAKGLASKELKEFSQRDVKAEKKDKVMKQSKDNSSNKIRKERACKPRDSEVLKPIRPVRKCVKRSGANDSNNSTQAYISHETVEGTIYETTNETEEFGFENNTDISASESDDEYAPPSKKVIGQNNSGSKSNIRSIGSPKIKRGITQLKANSFKNLNKIGNPSTVPIQSQLSQRSKSALQELGSENDAYLKQAEQLSSTPVMIKCSENDCPEMYPSWALLARHLKYFHYDGCLPRNGDVWLKVSMLAEEGKDVGKLYVHRCEVHSCEFTSTTEKLLKEHNRSHNNGLTHVCGFPDCPKAFKLLHSLKIHVQKHTNSLKCTSVENLTKQEQNKSQEEDSQRDTSMCTENGLCAKDGLKCDLCDKQFSKEISLTRHRKRMHKVGQTGKYRCMHEGCGKTFTKKEKLDIHLCEHSPERRLFCEKCGQSFSCQRYLDVHHKIHLKNEAHAANPPARTILCEQDGCQKMFTTRENMKSHVLNQHRGRKPCSLPGVAFPCTFPGCGKKFSFRSTLYRHKKLVHRGGDYKLGRRVVQYPCTYDGGCGKIFNRKNLLEEHLVMVHGKSTPHRLLPLRNKALDFTEQVCTHCGMVLTHTLFSRHTQLYHSSDTVRDLSENKAFPCHLEGCNEIFNTQEDRMEHVQSHIASPPYSCQVKGCQEYFFLERNLDNHLWNHSREVSRCSFEGCSQTFDDQLELAKHSKVHYNGKMRCPWPNCDNWLTETGQLRPHLMAHSRALHASGWSDFICEVCQLAFSSRWGLMIHKRMHGEDAAAVAKPTLPRLTKFSCEEPDCPATFCDQKGFFDHFLYHFTRKTCVCDVDGCNQNFSDLMTLSKHTKIHFDGKYKCPWQGCSKFFASPFIVKRHVYRHIVGKSRFAGCASHVDSSHDSSSNQRKRPEGDRDGRSWPFPCGQCFMVFRDKTNLASHMEYHNEKSEYVCPTCGKKGKHKHAKAPSGATKPGKVHACERCGATYSTISGLKFHLLQKHKIGEWPFKCSYCDKGFVSSRELQRHIPSHTKEKPFVCDICGASFASHTGHRAHLRKHAGQKYVCEVEGCGKVYTTAISLRGHRAQHAGFSKICPYCGKTYKNPYGHKCKASREGKRKLLAEPQTDERQETKQGPSAGMSETSLHGLQSSSAGLLDQQQQQHQPQQQHPTHHQQVIGMIQQQPMYQHHHPHHHQAQHPPPYVIPNSGALVQVPEAFSPLIPSVVPQGPMLAPSTAASTSSPE